MERLIEVSTLEQRLTLTEQGRVVMDLAISTAKRGVGEQRGSYQTPRGWHQVRARIGNGAPLNAVFVGRRPTGEIYRPEWRELYPERDWILTRILWLSGLEVGFNRLGNVDTMRRYIYIHGTPDSEPMGIAESHGCIRMRNEPLIELFERVPVGTRVLIDHEGRSGDGEMRC